MADYIEGKRPVIEALRAQMPLISVLMADNVQQDSQIKDILRKAKQYDVPVKTVPRKVLDERSERSWCCSITLPMRATLAPSRVRLT